MIKEENEKWGPEKETLLTEIQELKMEKLSLNQERDSLTNQLKEEKNNHESQIALNLTLTNQLNSTYSLYSFFHSIPFCHITLFFVENVIFFCFF